MKSKGFTIIETMVSITIFSILMAIVFGAWSEFQKIAFKHEGKNDTNITFVNVYKNVDKYITSASTQLFQCYNKNNVFDDATNSQYENMRWFAFLLSRENNRLEDRIQYATIPNVHASIADRIENPPGSVINFSQPVLIYNTCVLYLLRYEPNHCKGFNYCPHKTLYRYVFPTSQECNLEYPYDMNHNPTSNDPNEHLFNAQQKFKIEIDTNVKAILEDPINNAVAKPSIIEKNIVDLQINKNDEQIHFDLTLLRISDAERHLELGTEHQLTNFNATNSYDEKVKKYIESLSWISTPKNN